MRDARRERRVVVHLVLAIDLKSLAAGEDVGQQLRQRGGKIVALRGKDRELLTRTLDVPSFFSSLT